jgi:hypothetical protein
VAAHADMGYFHPSWGLRIGHLFPLGPDGAMHVDVSYTERDVRETEECCYMDGELNPPKVHLELLNLETGRTTSIGRYTAEDRRSSCSYAFEGKDGQVRLIVGRWAGEVEVYVVGPAAPTTIKIRAANKTG